jgi:putative Mg2+ transporter-C (MgtC) family protein
VRGLNTAATLWASAAVGACAGADLVAQAALLTVFVLMTNTLLRPLVNAINRLPFDERASEATYEVRLTMTASAAPAGRELLEEKLAAANYPVSEIEEIDRPDGLTELVAVLMSTSVDSKELDAVVNVLSTQPRVRHATWSVRTVE